MARGTAVALVGGLAESVVAWVGQMLLARLLGPGGFGSYSMGLALVRILAQLSTLGLASATIYFLSRYARDHASKARDVLVQSIGASFVTGLVAGLVLFLFSPLIARDFFHRVELSSMLRVFAVSIGFVAAFRVARAATTVSYRISYRVFLDLVASGSFVLFFLAFYLFGERLGGAAVAFFLSAFLVFVASVFSLIRLFPAFFASWSRPSFMLRELFTYSIPAFVASLFWVPQGWMDRLLLGYFRPPAEVGLYQAALQSVSPLYIGSVAVVSIASPMIANLFNRNQRDRLQETYRVSAKWILYSTLVIFVVIAAGPRDVLRMFFGPRYIDGTTPMMIVAIGAVIDNADGPSRSMLLLTGHQNALLRISIAALVLQFALDLLLIPRYGIRGAAVAGVAVSAMLSGTMLISVKHFLGMTPYDARYVKGLIAALATGAALYLIRPHGISIVTVRLALRACIAVAAFGSVILALGLDSEDRHIVGAAIERYLRPRGEDGS